VKLGISIRVVPGKIERLFAFLFIEFPISGAQKTRGSEHSARNLFKCLIRVVTRCIIEIRGHTRLRHRQLQSFSWLPHCQIVSPPPIRFLHPEDRPNPFAVQDLSW
jgi:hypothetical protein